MVNVSNFSKIEDLNDVINGRREKELQDLGLKEEKEAPIYCLKAKYKKDVVELRVDKEYIKSKGEEAVKKILFPYLILKLKRKNAIFNSEKVEVGFYKNNRRVKYKNFIK